MGNGKNRETLKEKNMTKIENQTAVTFTGETTKLPSGAIKKKGVYNDVSRIRDNCLK